MVVISRRSDICAWIRFGMDLGMISATVATAHHSSPLHCPTWSQNTSTTIQLPVEKFDESRDWILTFICRVTQ